MDFVRLCLSRVLRLRRGHPWTGDGVTVQGTVRTLVAHESTGYEEWGAAGTVRIDPGASGRGLSPTLAPAWGAAARCAGQLRCDSATSPPPERAFLLDSAPAVR